ncbi:unnamed protein product, partial [Iphiclides podalirius]
MERNVEIVETEHSVFVPLEQLAIHTRRNAERLRSVDLIEIVRQLVDALSSMVLASAQMRVKVLNVGRILNVLQQDILVNVNVKMVTSITISCNAVVLIVLLEVKTLNVFESQGCVERLRNVIMDTCVITPCVYLSVKVTKNAL